MDSRLAASHELPIDDGQFFDAIGHATALQRLEVCNLAFVASHDELSAARVRHIVLRAELVQEPAAFDAQPRLQRSRRIVQAGVDHTAVVRARFEAGARMPLEDAHRSPALGNRERRGEAGDAGADDRDIDPFHPRQRF